MRLVNVYAFLRYLVEEGIVAPDYAHKVVHHMAALAINYFKKDTQARWFYGIFGNFKKNSFAAERILL